MGRTVALGLPRELLVAVTVVCAAFAFAPPAFAAASPPALVHATRVGAAPAGPVLADATPARLSRRFGASAGTRARALRYLRRSGATDVRIDATGLLAEATMKVGLAERVFAAPLARFETADRTRFVAPAVATRLPAALRGFAARVFERIAPISCSVVETSIP